MTWLVCIFVVGLGLVPIEGAYAASESPLELTVISGEKRSQFTVGGEAGKRQMAFVRSHHAPWVIDLSEQDYQYLLKRASAWGKQDKLQASARCAHAMIIAKHRSSVGRTAVFSACADQPSALSAELSAMANRLSLIL